MPPPAHLSCMCGLPDRASPLSLTSAPPPPPSLPPPPTHTHRYAFATPSTLKPTQWHYPSGSINQIPGTATICGDMRVTPFYDVEQVMSKVRIYVDDLNSQPDQHLCKGQRGPCSRYELPEDDLKGRLELKFFDNVGKGVSNCLHTVTTIS